MILTWLGNVDNIVRQIQLFSVIQMLFVSLEWSYKVLKGFKDLSEIKNWQEFVVNLKAKINQLCGKAMINMVGSLLVIESQEFEI